MHLEFRKRSGDLGLLWGIHCQRRSCSTQLEKEKERKQFTQTATVLFFVCFLFSFCVGREKERKERRIQEKRREGVDFSRRDNFIDPLTSPHLTSPLHSELSQIATHQTTIDNSHEAAPQCQQLSTYVVIQYSLCVPVFVSGSGSVKKTYGGVTPLPFTFQKVTYPLSLLL